MTDGPNAAMAKRAIEHGKEANKGLAPRRPLEVVAMRPGISLYVGHTSYVDTSLNTKTHRKLRLWDAGTHCLVQSVDDSGKVIDEAELLWHAVWYRKAAK